MWRKLPSVPLKTTMRFQLKYVSKIFVEKQLKSMKKKKATGLDGLPSVLLRDCSKTISKPLCFMINLSITSKRFLLYGNQLKSYPSTNLAQREIQRTIDPSLFFLLFQKYWKKPCIYNLSIT